MIFFERRDYLRGEAMPMDWPTLLCNSRMHDPEPTATRGRSPFQQDLDRIIFSAAFRRFAHKTQVHPLSPNDHVHTRLTHSIEVASVGRSLGTMVGNEIASKLKSKILPDYFGYAVQAACLAHDIGSPPFGHSGESAIQSWFKTAQRKAGIFTKVNADTRREDFERFEGNAQGFRILTQLENAKWDGGLRLTYAVLGAFAKYPIASHISDEDPDHYPGAKKFGFFNILQRLPTSLVSSGATIRLRIGVGIHSPFSLKLQTIFVMLLLT
jgi:dGTPase